MIVVCIRKIVPKLSKEILLGQRTIQSPVRLVTVRENQNKLRMARDLVSIGVASARFFFVIQMI